jgi:uncharacterized heparinase superfamily protein
MKKFFLMLMALMLALTTLTAFAEEETLIPSPEAESTPVQIEGFVMDVTDEMILMLTGDGRELRGEDALLPQGRKRRAGLSLCAIRFHLGEGAQVSTTADGLGAILRLPGGPLWQFRCRGGALVVEDCVWIDADGRPVATQQLMITGEAAAGGASVSWALKKA